jgi:murein DD-endopeptidase MepM/ murein hydrolase activator NlpD
MSFHWPFDKKVRVPGRWKGLGTGKARTTQFMARREGGRLHAACDLMAPRGTAIHAVCDGTVLSYVNGFKDPRDNPPGRLDAALTVLHQPEGLPAFIVRYGEVEPRGTNGISWSKGNPVDAGEVIAEVGRHRQLHFELYASGDNSPGLSISWGGIGRRQKTPNAYTQDDIDALTEAGYEPYFQRRKDLANPSDFLQALQKGETPPAVHAFRSPGGEVLDATIQDSVVFHDPSFAFGFFPGWSFMRRPPGPRDVNFHSLQRLHSLGEEDER